MRITIFSILIILISLSSCTKEKIEIINPVKDIPNFVATWSRTYDILGSEFKATYKIDTNEIYYSNKGSGPGNTDYIIEFDSYQETDKRWIGHRDNNQYYLLFFKDIDSESITIYKQKVDNPNDAQNIAIPADDTNENYGWNIYYKE